MKTALAITEDETQAPVVPWCAISPSFCHKTECQSGARSVRRGCSRPPRSPGPNELPEAPPPSLVKLFLSQFTSVIVWVLIGAAIISGLLEDWLDAAAILAIVLLNGVLGFVQEFRAERSLAALRKMSVATARVFRDGILRSIPARELVLGDLILLEAGDRIPADARLIYTTNFQTQEASLTGESTPVQKSVDVLIAGTDCRSPIGRTWPLWAPSRCPVKHGLLSWRPPCAPSWAGSPR